MYIGKDHNLLELFCYNSMKLYMVVFELVNQILLCSELDPSPFIIFFYVLLKVLKVTNLTTNWSL